MKTKPILVIGNGIAGVTFARNFRKKSTQEICILSDESPFFFSRTALMYVYMGHMKFEHTQPYENDFWEKNNIQLKQARVEQVYPDEQRIELADGSSMEYEKLVIACGSKPNFFGWPGQDLKGVQGLYHKKDLESMEVHTQKIKHAVVVGGGLIGVEMAEMLQSRGIGVTFLVREKLFWNGVLPDQEAQLISSHIADDHGVDLRLSTELDAIVDDGNGAVKAVKLKGTNEQIDCQFVGITTGVSPQIDWLKKSSIECEKGILVDEFFQSSAPNVYAIGDCAQLKNPPKGRRAIEAVWYVGRMMGERLANNLAGDSQAYSPGPWFNSAKFFDIEYQTYGTVLSNPPEGCKSLYWENRKKGQAMHLQYSESTKKVLGVNVFGIRMRHEVWDRWLSQGKTLEEIIPELQDAWFDPELYLNPIPEIVQSFEQQSGLSFQLKKKSWKRILGWV